MRKTVLSFGETLWDLLPTGPVLGGAPCNFACRVQSLGDRGLVVTRLGRDDWGRQAAEILEQLGAETEFAQWDDQHPTGTVHVTLNEQGSPDFSIIPDVAYDYIEPTAGLLTLAAAADCFCFGTLIQRSPANRMTLRQLLEAATGALKVLDINLRKNCYSEETIRESLEWADVLKLNEDEARHLGQMLRIPADPLPDFCDAMIGRWKLQCCLVTLGERGAFAVAADGVQVYSPGFQVVLKDTCGSGDAFTAGFTHKLLRRHALQDCCEFGNALGALVAMQSGATASVSMEDIQRFLAEKPGRIWEPNLKPFAVV